MNPINAFLPAVILFEPHVRFINHVTFYNVIKPLFFFVDSRKKFLKKQMNMHHVKPHTFFSSSFRITN